MRTIILPIIGVKLPTTNPARIDRANNRDFLLFNDTTNQTCQWQFRTPENFLSGLVMKIQFACKSNQTDTKNVKFNVYVMAVTPEDDVSINTDSFDSVNTETKTLDNNESQNYLKELSITLSNNDGLIAGDLIVIKLERDASNDTATDDIRVVAVSLEYS